MAAPESSDGPDGARGERVARVTMVDGGPVLVEGPVEIELDDGTRVRSERPVVALCACRRSRRYPFCDTSHRRKVRPGDDRAGPRGQAAPTATGRSDDDPADQHVIR